MVKKQFVVRCKSTGKPIYAKVYTVKDLNELQWLLDVVKSIYKHKVIIDIYDYKEN